MQSILTSKWTKVVVFILSLVPLGVLVWRGLHNDLSANAVEFVEHWTGDWTIRFLIVTLAVTPLRKIFKIPQLIRFRRMLGLFAFFYGCLHFSTWLALDRYFNWPEMLKDVAKRPFITVGFAGFVLMIPLAIHFHIGLDSPPRRQTLAAAASRDLLERNRRCDSLLLAGKIRRPEAAAIRRDRRHIACVEDWRMALRSKARRRYGFIASPQ